MLRAHLCLILAVTRPPELIMATQVDADDSIRCTAVCFRSGSPLHFKYAPSVFLMEATEPGRKSDTETAYSIRSIFKIKHPVQTPDHISHHYINITTYHHQRAPATYGRQNASLLKHFRWGMKVEDGTKPQHSWNVTQPRPVESRR